MSKIINEAAMTVLFVLIIALLGFYISSNFVLSLVLIAIVASILVQKIYVDDEISTQAKTKTKFVLMFSEKIDAISRNVQAVREDVAKNASSIAERLYEMKHLYDVESAQQYRETSKRIIELEQSLAETKKNLSLAFASLEERIEQKQNL